MSSNLPVSFINEDFYGRQEFYYCEDKEQWKNIYFIDHDRCIYSGPGIYYVEERVDSCGDVFYVLDKMTDRIVDHLFYFCDEVKNILENSHEEE